MICLFIRISLFLVHTAVSLDLIDEGLVVPTVPPSSVSVDELERHIKASVTDTNLQTNLLRFGFDPEVIPYLSLLPADQPILTSLLFGGVTDRQDESGDLYDDDDQIALMALFRPSATNSWQYPVWHRESIERAQLLVEFTTADLPVEIVQAVPCGWSNKAIFSYNHGIARDVRSPQACQFLCQGLVDLVRWNQCSEDTRENSAWDWFKNLFNIYNPYSATDDNSAASQCAGITYFPHEHTCVLHRQITALFELEGVYSAPSICKGGKVALSIANYGKSKQYRRCLEGAVSTVRLLDDASMSALRTRVEWGQLNYDLNLSLSSLEEVLPTLRVVWGVLGEPRLLLQKSFAVDDIRSCIVLCSADPNCVRWNWVEINSSQWCYKSSNMGLINQVVDIGMNDWLKGASGLREWGAEDLLASIPLDAISEAQAFSIDDEASGGACVFAGFIGASESLLPGDSTTRTIWSSIDHAVVASAASARECRRFCETKTDCRSWQYTPDDLAGVSEVTGLPATCSLHTMEVPKLYPAMDNRIVTGFSRLDNVVTTQLLNSVGVPLCWDKLPAVGPIVPYSTTTQLASSQSLMASRIRRSLGEEPVFSSPEVSESTDQSSDQSSDVLCDEYLGVLYGRVSFRGRLLSSGASNMELLATVEDCALFCKNTKGCIAYSQGAWGACYLFDRVDQLISDQFVTSGYPFCNLNSYPDIAAAFPSDGTGADGTGADGTGGQTPTGFPRFPNPTEERKYDTCSGARMHFAHEAGDFIEQIKFNFSSPQECWTYCRKKSRCFHSVFIDISDTVSADGTQYIPGNETNCVLFKTVQDEIPTFEHRQAITVPANCDTYGTYIYGNAAAGELKGSRVNWTAFVSIIAASATGAIALGIIVANLTKKPHKEETPLLTPTSPRIQSAQLIEQEEN
ncbi:PAN domain protein [Gregarina niphandrodes]|uniref:PAN domain protein n=1 Tax=Gregarina niphandrodes TaxID=110365 RepID=A0A023AXP8_GRENI|nr:PAN domain protein [Gregarina niphandrodes]EZG43427.1 PAN domain protein [Gregarina niphandrodes]|eukprot:XP_011133347.1 PAN domain protein [Gregarina niphandrodes]